MNPHAQRGAFLLSTPLRFSRRRAGTSRRRHFEQRDPTDLRPLGRSQPTARVVVVRAVGL